MHSFGLLYKSVFFSLAFFFANTIPFLEKEKNRNAQLSMTDTAFYLPSDIEY